MKIILTGCAGQLGRELKRSLSVQAEVIALDRNGLDLADADALRSMLEAQQPDVIVNAAAWTAVDKAETEEAAARAINTTAPGVLAVEAARVGARLIHFSTDYVFDGSKSQPYVETDTTAPLSAYGRTKRDGELAILAAAGNSLILRTSWVYGVHGANFMKTMLRLGKERDELSVVDDQFGAPTWTRHLADATALLIAGAPSVKGIYHLTAGGETSWHDYAEAIFSEALRMGLMEKIPLLRRVASTNWPTPAQRPANSRLDCSRMRQQTGIALPDWRIGLTDCIADLRFTST